MRLYLPFVIASAVMASYGGPKVKVFNTDDVLSKIERKAFKEDIRKALEDLLVSLEENRKNFGDSSSLLRSMGSALDEAAQALHRAHGKVNEEKIKNFLTEKLAESTNKRSIESRETFRQYAKKQAIRAVDQIDRQLEGWSDASAHPGRETNIQRAIRELRYRLQTIEDNRHT